MQEHSVNISEFRANLLNYLEKANAGESISITSNGKLLATVSAPANQKEESALKLAQIAQTAKLHDVISPIEDDWGAMH